MTHSFTKMHGLGNDFIVMNNMTERLTLDKKAIAELAHRHTGVGFDQLLLIEPSSKADFFCRIYNADGSEAEQCGNGLRCVARFIHETGLCHESTFSIETKAGLFPVSIKNYDHITIEMNAPIIQHKLTKLPVQHAEIATSVLSIGNPHAVIKVPAIQDCQADKVAPIISSQAIFPHGANVGFMEIVTPHHIRLKTIERGAGETHACGSNACAAAVAGIANEWLQSPVQVEFKLGSLHIEWKGETSPVQMTGPASKVFDGLLNNR